MSGAPDSSKDKEIIPGYKSELIFDCPILLMDDISIFYWNWNVSGNFANASLYVSSAL